VILVDTSVWIDHFRTSHPVLEDLLNAENVVMHPWVPAELALGNLRDRVRTLHLLGGLPHIPVASIERVLELVEQLSLQGKGVGLIDVQLVASVLDAEDVRLWTHDRRLAAVATNLGMQFDVEAET